MADKKNQIRLNYVKTSNYRTYHVDGIYGGLTPQGKLYIEPFVERQVTPQSVIHEIENFKFGKSLDSEGKEGIIREIECGLILDINIAVVMRGWLDDRINEHKRLTDDYNKKKKKNK